MTPEHEEWRAVVGYEGLYEVSDRGRVRSLDRVTHNGRRLRGRPLALGMTSAGRPAVTLSAMGKGTKERVSVLVLTAFVGPRPEGYEGCHNDGNPSNNDLRNLRWDTPSANAHDKILHGRNSELRKNHCPRGHLLVAPNIALGHVRRGYRSCLACHRSLCKRWRAERQGVEFDIQRDSDARYEQIMRAAHTFPPRP